MAGRFAFFLAVENLNFLETSHHINVMELLLSFYGENNIYNDMPQPTTIIIYILYTIIYVYIIYNS